MSHFVFPKQARRKEWFPSGIPSAGLSRCAASWGVWGQGWAWLVMVMGSETLASGKWVPGLVCECSSDGLKGQGWGRGLLWPLLWRRNHFCGTGNLESCGWATSLCSGSRGSYHPAHNGIAVWCLSYRLTLPCADFRYKYSVAETFIHVWFESSSGSAKGPEQCQEAVFCFGFWVPRAVSL